MVAYAAVFLMGNPTSRTTEENRKLFKSALHQAVIKHVSTTNPKLSETYPGSNGTSSVTFVRNQAVSQSKNVKKKNTKTRQPNV